MLRKAVERLASYGIENHSIAQRQMLHSCYLRFIHPITGEKMEFFSDIASDMAEFVEKHSL